MKQNKARSTQGSGALILMEQLLYKNIKIIADRSTISKINHKESVLWGSIILDYGQYCCRYKSGRKGDWFLGCFAARKQVITIYLLCDVSHPKLDFSDLGT